VNISEKNFRSTLIKTAAQEVSQKEQELQFRSALVKTASKEIALKEQELEFRHNLVRHAMLKSALGLQSGSVPYRAATNLVVEDFPFEDHPQISAIKSAIEEAFSPQMVQRMMIAGKPENLKINVQDIMKQHASTSGGNVKNVDTPFYIRLKFTKTLLPPATADSIKQHIEKTCPALLPLMDEMDSLDLAPLPFYAKEEKNDKKGLEELAQTMAAHSNMKIGLVWNNILKSINSGGEYKNIVQQWSRATYPSAIQEPIERVGNLRHKNDLLRAIWYAETPNAGAKTGYPEHKLNKDALKAIIDEHYKKMKNPYKSENVDNETVNQSIADKTYEKIVKVFDLPPEQRDIAVYLGTVPRTGSEAQKEAWRKKQQEIINIYSDLHQPELRFVLQAMRLGNAPLKTIRYHAVPRKYPNGIDVPHIYPPIKWEDGKYALDVENGNLGLRELKRNAQVLGDFIGKHSDKIMEAFEQLTNYNKQHPVMLSHTSADNLSILLDQLSGYGMPAQTPFNKIKFPGSEYFKNELQEIATQYGSNVATWIAEFLAAEFKEKKKSDEDVSAEKSKTSFEQKKQEIKDYALKLSSANMANPKTARFASLLLKASPRGPKVNERMFDEVEDLYQKISKLGYPLAKLMDYLRYVIEEKTPDPVRGTRGRNYAAAGQSGEIMIAVQYAYNAKVEDITHGVEENAEIMDSVLNKQLVRLNMLRKTVNLPSNVQEAPTMPLPQGKVSKYRMAKLVPDLRYIVTQKTGAMHRGTEYKIRGITDKDTKKMEGQENVYEENYASSTLDGALERLENLYPQASDMLADELHILRLRMEVVEKRIMQSIQNAIEIRLAQMSQNAEPVIVQDATNIDQPSVVDDSYVDQVDEMEKEIEEIKPQYASPVEEEIPFEEDTEKGQLPHFDSPQVSCPKCKSQYFMISDDSASNNLVEQMNCNHCGFAWTEPAGPKNYDNTTVQPQDLLKYFVDTLIMNDKFKLVKLLNNLLSSYPLFKLELLNIINTQGMDAATTFLQNKYNEETTFNVSSGKSLTNDLLKIANKLDLAGLTHLSNKVDLILAKIGS